jgi:hypothetical protein
MAVSLSLWQRQDSNPLSKVFESRILPLCHRYATEEDKKKTFFFNISLKFDKKVTIRILVIVKLFFSTQGLSLFSRAMYYTNFRGK